MRGAGGGAGRVLPPRQIEKRFEAVGGGGGDAARALARREKRLRKNDQREFEQPFHRKSVKRGVPIQSTLKKRGSEKKLFTWEESNGSVKKKKGESGGQTRIRPLYLRRLRVAGLC